MNNKDYPYPVGSIVNCGKRSFIIRDWEAGIRIPYCGGSVENYIKPKLSRPIINGVMQKNGCAYECERVLISKGLAKLYCDKTNCKYCGSSDYAYYGKCNRQNVFIKHDEDGNFYCDSYMENEDNV